MKPKRSIHTLARLGAALALMAVMSGCTKGGQFDPIEIFSSDVFDNKKKITGQREPVFPNGVPGAATGVPPDLVKGYQAPPDQAADNAAVPPPEAAQAAKPKPKPKPKLARAPAPPPPPRTRIDISPQSASSAPAQQPQSSQSAWPSGPAAAPAQSSQSVWPSAQPAAAPQQTAQPAQSIWPNPPAPGTTPR